MSNFIKFATWLENRVNEMEVGSMAGVTGGANDMDKNKKAALAAQKYKIDFSKIAKDPKAKMLAQQQIIGDKNLGPDVAADMFKNT